MREKFLIISSKKFDLKPDFHTKKTYGKCLKSGKKIVATYLG